MGWIALCMVGLWTESWSALQEYRLAWDLGLPVYRYVAEEIRPMPATMLPVYDMLTEEASTHAADWRYLTRTPPISPGSVTSSRPGVVLTRAEVVHRVLAEWRQAKLAKLVKPAKVAKTP